MVAFWHRLTPGCPEKWLLNKCCCFISHHAVCIQCMAGHKIAGLVCTKSSSQQLHNPEGFLKKTCGEADLIRSVTMEDRPAGQQEVIKSL